MTSTKRIISIALVLVLIVSAFTACGKKDKPATNPDAPSTTVNPSETDVSVPSIEDDAESEPTTADAGKDNTDTADAGETANTGKDNPSSAGKPASKPSNSSSAKPNPSSAKPNQKPTTTKPAPKPSNPSSATKPNPKPETTTKPSSSGGSSSSTPTANTYAYFKASTGERIKYLTYRGELDGARCTGIKESNGKIVATYDIGASEEWWKCDNCGKYLCEGCQPAVSPKCPKCGRTDCMDYTYDVTCYRCGKFVKGGTCHPCQGGLPGYEYPYDRSQSDIIF